jgi:hypothetical protein
MNFENNLADHKILFGGGAFWDRAFGRGEWREGEEEEEGGPTPNDCPHPNWGWVVYQFVCVE